MMNPEIKAKWVEALRSGKYQQGAGKLHNPADDTYCCLGVLCNVMGAEFGEAVETDVDDWYGKLYDHVPRVGDRVLSCGEDEELKEAVCAELGIKDQHTLMAMNDGCQPNDAPEIRKHSFQEIASYIDANL